MLVLCNVAKQNRHRSSPNYQCTARTTASRVAEVPGMRTLEGRGARRTRESKCATLPLPGSITQIGGATRTALQHVVASCAYPKTICCTVLSKRASVVGIHVQVA
eukprot:4957821-Alexandrium_andersonii.AAC.1